MVTKHDNSYDDIRALEVLWKQARPFEAREPSSIHLWGEPPRINHVYDITMRGDVSIDVERPFWVFYQDPIVWENGFETLDGIASLAFCLCEKVAIRQQDTKRTQLSVNVLKIIEIDEIKQLPERYTLTADLYDTFLSAYARYSQVEDFIIIETNYQGDCGATYIIEKQENQYFLRLENQWSFYENTWVAPNIDVELSMDMLNKL